MYFNGLYIRDCYIFKGINQLVICAKSEHFSRKLPG